MWKSSGCFKNNQLCPYSNNGNWNFLRLDTCDRLTAPTKQKNYFSCIKRFLQKFCSKKQDSHLLCTSPLIASSYNILYEFI